MLQVLTSLIPGLFKLGDKLIEDKDKKAEYAFNTQKMAQDLALKLLETKTYPIVDALVKLAYAGEVIVKGLFRPIFSCGLFIFGLLYPESVAKLSELGMVGEAAQFAVYGAAPAWGVDRGVEKYRKTSKKKVVVDPDSEEMW